MENKSNKGLIVALIIAILIIIGLGCVFGYKMLKDDNNILSDNSTTDEEDIEIEKLTPIESSDTVSFMIDENTWAFYSDYSKQNMIGKFNCGEFSCGVGVIKGDYAVIGLCEDSSCTVDTYGGLYFTSINGGTTTGKILLYNIKESKQIEVFDNVTNIFPSSSVVLIKYATSDTDNQYRLISYDGYVNRKITKKFVLSCYEGCNIDDYKIDYINNLLVVSDGKYGIETITTGKQIIDYKYDNIYLLDNNMFIGTLNGKQNIYKIGNKKAVLSKSYDYLLNINKSLINDSSIKEQIFVAINNNKIDIINLKGKSVIKNPIESNETIELVEYMPKYKDGYMISSYTDENYNVVENKYTIRLSIKDSSQEIGVKFIEYLYDSANQTLTKK